MNYYDHPTYQHLIAAIRSSPADDLPRLVAADWLEENGESERAEWMRFSIASPSAMGCVGDSSVGQGCPYTPDRGERLWCPNCDIAIGWGLPERLAGEDGYEYRRGFVHTVRAPLSALIGVVCGRCGTTRPWCPDCHGTGRTVGVLRELVKREPVERVDVVDREPHPNSYVGSTVCGWQAEATDPVMFRGRSFIPYGLLKVMAELDGDDLDGRTWLTFPAESAARDALSRALLRWASQPECGK
jgi:uncharacterized protein (TIGR02996 family)